MLWTTSPSCTELETLVMDWLVSAMNLPRKFHSKSGKGGGVIQGTASEAILVCMVAAIYRYWGGRCMSI
jgi:aromatic-L-amino-acid decarboxylase